MSDGYLLQAEDLKKYFEMKRGLFSRSNLYVRAVDGVSFGIPSGSVFGLVGESGCGKTTLGRLLLRLIDPTGGHILFGGVDISALSQRELKKVRRDMQIIFQDPYDSLNPRMSVGQIISEPLKIHGLWGSNGERTILQVLGDVEMQPPLDFIARYPHELSGGQRQRIAIARAIVQRPRFVVADEPVSMLDVSIRVGVLNLLVSLKEKYGLTMLFITHDLGVARYISDHLGVMYLGRIVEMASVEQVVSRPLHPYTQALIAAVPRPDPDHRLTEKELPVKGEVASPINIPPACRFNPRCPYATDLCRTVDPPFVDDVIRGHYAACHYAYKFT